MEHRCTERIQSKLEVIILKQGLPVGVGVIRNGNRWGLYVESDFKHLETEHQICLSVVRAKHEKQTAFSMEIDGIIIHKNNKGFGLEIDIGSHEQADLFTRMLKNSDDVSFQPLNKERELLNSEPANGELLSSELLNREPLKLAANA